jgi:hypothetical protein
MVNFISREDVLAIVKLQAAEAVARVVLSRQREYTYVRAVNFDADALERVIREEVIRQMEQEILQLFSFLAPNPNWRSDPKRNVMGQTEEEFWNAVDGMQVRSIDYPEQMKRDRAEIKRLTTGESP